MTSPEQPAPSARARALWVVEPGRAQLRVEPLARVGPDEALVRTHVSGVSRGTESLVLRAGVPLALRDSMRCPHQAGSFALPVKYGYCAVGVVERGPARVQGKRVFCLHPHQDAFVVPAAELHVIPDEVPAERAVLAANMETAVNALWDAAPLVGSRVAVVGAGAVGLLAASLLSQTAGVELQVVDVNPERESVARALGLELVAPGSARDGCDLVLNASGAAEGLTTALDLLGFEGHLVELSWYGDRDVCVPLGGRFHQQRLRITASQVGNVSPAQRARWSHARRMRLALRLLADARYDSLLGEPIAFEQAADAWSKLLEPEGPGVTPFIRYF